MQDRAGSRCVRLHAGEPRDVQLSAGQVPAVQEAVGRPEQVQEVQEGLESVRTLLGSVREVPLAQVGVVLAAAGLGRSQWPVSSSKKSIH